MADKLARADDPTRPTPVNTPKQVLVALVDLNEVHRGLFNNVIDAMHAAMDRLGRGTP